MKEQYPRIVKLSVFIVLILSMLVVCAAGAAGTQARKTASVTDGPDVFHENNIAKATAAPTDKDPRTDNPVTEANTGQPSSSPTSEDAGTDPVTVLTTDIQTETTGNEPDPVIVQPEKVIYLTFDDGPGPYTARLLEILDKYNVKATFFVVNKPRYNYLITKEYEAGHSIGVHAYLHKYAKVYASDEAYFEDFWDMNEVVKEYTGSYSNLLRFPGGSSNTVSKNYSKGIMSRLTKAVEAEGLHYFDWNVTSGDAGDTTDTDEVYKNVIKGIGNRSWAIVLQHDTKGFSVAAVERIIIWGLENGYTFLPLDENSPGAHHRIAN